MDFNTISGALASAKAAFDLLMTATQLRDAAKIKDAMGVLNDRIIDIQNSALYLQKELATRQEECETAKSDARQIKARVAELERQRHQQSQYSLHELSMGVFVLAPNETHENPTPAHYICQPRMDNVAKKVILQRQESVETVDLVCHECKAVYFTSERKQYEPFIPPSDYDPHGRWR
ncbi:hypothetical protein [Paraburkholderia fungorum]|uniref:hypothetical protein n=1 Tax=Paraburkholderia fungorum TaxID=134537 RepID=UPI00402B9390